jgi:hypothetical protein
VRTGSSFVWNRLVSDSLRRELFSQDLARSSELRVKFIERVAVLRVASERVALCLNVFFVISTT